MEAKVAHAGHAAKQVINHEIVGTIKKGEKSLGKEKGRMRAKEAKP